ncbi:hypothetical protein [Achromobacter xylosoxidans]|uniref:hypothetical protein n=1 Tax=Alcaligenes xylosoxydans xylosoxydans TaxID=85698 RepID=UPI001F13BA6C|nr:hypothetical protein [Achromobacter xylosoxidans]
MDPAQGGVHIAAGLQQREHGVGRLRGGRVLRRGNAEQLLPVAQGFVHESQVTGRNRRDAHDFRRLDLVAQQAGGQRVRQVIATQLEVVAHQDLLGLAAGGQRAVRAAQQRQRPFVVAQLFLDAREQQRVVGQARMAAQHVAQAARGFAQLARVPDLLDALRAFFGAQLGHAQLRGGGAQARTHEGLEPLGIQAFGEQRGVVRQVQPAIFHRVGLPDLVHQRRRIVARHADALGAGGHRGDQLGALFDRHVVGRHGVDVRDEHHLVPAQQVDQLLHLLLDLVVRLLTLDDAGKQVPIVRRQALEDGILVQPCAPLGEPFVAGLRPERAGARPVGEELAEVAPQVVGLDRIAADGQQLARGQLDHIQVGRLVHAAPGLLAVRRTEDHALHVGGNLGLAEHEAGLLQRLGAGVHETVVAPELLLDRVARHGIAQRGMDAAGADRSDGKGCHSGPLLCLMGCGGPGLRASSTTGRTEAGGCPAPTSGRTPCRRP